MRENWQIQSLTRNWWMRFRKISCEILGGKISRVTFLHTWPRLYMGVESWARLVVRIILCAGRMGESCVIGEVKFTVWEKNGNTVN